MIKLKAALNVSISPLVVIFGEVLFLGVVGGVIAYFLQPMHGFHYEKGYAIISYFSILYVSAMMAIVYYKLSLGKRLLAYIEKRCMIPSRSVLLIGWGITFSLVLFCFVWLIIQVGLKHPFFYVGSLSTLEVAVLRSEMSQSISTSISNIGLTFLMPLNIVISLLLSRRIMLSILSFGLLIAFGTFTLTKSSIVYVLEFVLLLQKRNQFHHLI